MIRRPPRSTLFPYRRSSDLDRVVEVARVVRIDRDEGHLREVLANARFFGRRGAGGGRCFRDGGVGRSEEHTSELQSQSNLVCRLLLEKKNKQGTRSSRAT